MLCHPNLSRLLPFLLILAAAFPAAAQTVDCDSGDSLAAAIAAAPPGATLNVRGTCAGAVRITEDLTIHGEGGATIDATGAETDGVRIEGARVTLENITIRGGINSLNAIYDSFLILDNVQALDAVEDGFRLEQGHGKLTRVRSQGHGVAGIRSSPTSTGPTAFSSPPAPASSRASRWPPRAMPGTASTCAIARSCCSAADRRERFPPAPTQVPGCASPATRI